MKALTVSPRGFCAGVRRAIDVVDQALERFGPPIYVRKEIVHNQAVVENFKRRGVLFIDDLSDAPDGSTVIFSAHGIAPSVREEAFAKRLRTFDATCPLVSRVHFEVHRFLKEGYHLILIGHKDHDEVEGTMGEAPGKIHLVENPDDVPNLPFPAMSKIMVLTQTTLSVDETKETLKAIRARFPYAKTPPSYDICYATQNRQDAVKALVDDYEIDVLLVVGSKNSSNSRRLCEVARHRSVRAYLIDHAGEIQARWLEGVSKVGITAGASAPEHLVEDVVKLLADQFQAETEEVFVREENVVFSLPNELAKISVNA